MFILMVASTCIYVDFVRWHDFKLMILSPQHRWSGVTAGYHEVVIGCCWRELFDLLLHSQEMTEQKNDKRKVRRGGSAIERPFSYLFTAM